MQLRKRHMPSLSRSNRKTKIKNDKIACWRLLEKMKLLMLFSFNHLCCYFPHWRQTAWDPKCLVSPRNYSNESLYQITRNLPYFIEDIRKVTAACPVCSELKPRFHRSSSKLIKATQPFQPLNIDFKGPLSSCSQYKYLLIIVDEFFCFPFAFLCSDMKASSVIACLEHLFSIFGLYICQTTSTATGTGFLSNKLKTYLGNREIGTIWHAVNLALKTRYVCHKLGKHNPWGTAFHQIVPLCLY